MDKFAKFGVEPLLLAAQVVNFLVLLYLLKRFLYKPILAIIKKREDKIQQGLEDSSKAKELLLKTEQEEKKVLAKAGAQGKELLEVTKKRAGEVRQELLDKAKSESDVLVAGGREQIAQERDLAEKEFEASVAKAAVIVLEKVLPKTLSKQDHMRIFQESEQRLQKELS